MIQLTIVTPEKQIFEGQVDKIVAPTREGEIGILPHHINLMSSLAPGAVHIHQGNKVTTLALGEGLLQVDDGRVSILTDLAKEAHEIDEKAVEEARKRATEALATQTLSNEEYATALAVLEKATAQLHVKRRHHVR